MILVILVNGPASDHDAMSDGVQQQCRLRGYPMPMNRFRKVAISCIIALAPVLLSGCAHPPQPVISKQDWTTQGSGAFHIDRGPVFQGVGWAEAIGNSSLLRAAADNRARDQLAGLLYQYVSALFQYAGHDKQDMETRQAISTVVHQGLDQAMITDHRYDEALKRLYARCILELATFKQLLTSWPVAGSSDENLAAHADQVFEAFVTTAP